MKKFVHLLTAVLPFVVLFAQPALAQTGSLQVTISPQAAIDAGAKWQVDGGAWRDSGYTEPNLAIGNHTVEYSVIAGWNEPNSQTVQINDAQTTNTSGTYVQQIGSLEVTISPQAAIDAGAQWRVDEGTWHDSGYTEPNLVIGSYTVEYSVVAGWNEPNSQTVQINDGQMTTTSGTYIQQTGSLQVTISPQAAIDAGAKWQVDGGAWRDSGYTEPNLTVGNHTVEYSVVADWNEPNSQTVQINDGQTTSTSGTYIATGSLQVRIIPQDAIDEGAQWRVDGGIWRDSNDILTGLPVGSHTVEYKAIASWTTPVNRTVQINHGQITLTYGMYFHRTGAVQVTILPQTAIDAGAKWRVDNGTWQDSGYIQSGLSEGTHTVDYNQIADWNEPNSQTVEIVFNQTSTTTGTYIQHTGSLQVTIWPQEAVNDNAQWRVTGGAWRDSGYTEPNLIVGSYTVEYSVVAGWNEPNRQTVQINYGQATTTTGTYVQQTGSLQVIISPQEAIDAGAQWRVDGGDWQESGNTESDLIIGPYTVEYKPLPNFIGPNSQTIQIYYNQTTTTSGTYIPTGSLEVIISPQEAIDAGAQWRVDGGVWHDSNDIESNLVEGAHTVEYKTLPNFIEPNSQTVQVNYNQITTTSGTYIPTGSLQVTILPQAAIDAGAQWRVDGGIWHDSNDIEAGLPIGSHTVQYSVIFGWNEPNSQTVQINDNQTATTSGIYIRQTGSLQIAIWPQEAIDAGAQWRVDGGNWRDSEYTEPNLTVGPHTVEYKPLPNFVGPNSQTIQIYYEQTAFTFGTYVLAGSLQVTISPQEAIDAGAQWRVDGGIWHDSNDIEPNLVEGMHTVEYKTLPNFIGPNSQTVQINFEQTTTTSGTYVLAGSLQVTISPQLAIDAGAQWRVDGGIWRDSNDIELNLAVGPHTVEYKSLPSFIEPNSQTVQINFEQTITTSGTYIPTGSLRVAISPQLAIDAGAQWRVDGGIWRDSNDTEPNLAVGPHTLEYKPIYGWNEPNSRIVQIDYNQTTDTGNAYVRQLGSLRITISPQLAIDVGAQWRIDGGPWHDSNDIASNVFVGMHTVEYKTIPNFREPNSHIVEVYKGQTTTASGTYTPTGSLQVTIYPQGAIDAGALWRVDGGTWRQSGDIESGLVTGPHTVEYGMAPGWNEPNSRIVQINYAQTRGITGIYVRQTGSVKVTILPKEATDVGAQWRVDSGPWRDSDYIQSDIPVGFHMVEYKSLPDWNPPANEIIQVDNEQTTVTVGTYVPTGSLQVIITPQGAIDTGAQWRVDGGPWRDSTYIETGLSVGAHIIEYKPITGWDTPNSETVQIVQAQKTVKFTSYVSRENALQVTIFPQAAIDAGAQWRVDGGFWRDSNYIEPELAFGYHLVEYKTINNFKTPASEVIEIVFGQATTTSGTYIPTGSLQVIIAPQEAIDTGAQWRLDLGIWRDSNDIVTGLSAGAHIVEYKPLTGWDTPATETVQIDYNDITITTGNYIRREGSLQVIIIPPEVADANAQWRVDGGDWLDSDHTETGLLEGTHRIQYRNIPDWIPPDDEDVWIDVDQTTIIYATYIRSGSLQVLIAPQAAIDAGAKWRVDGVLWQDSNDVRTNLEIGPHTVEYLPIFGWNEPNNETVQIDHGQTTTTTGTYIQQLGSLHVTIVPQAAIDAGAQWRVNGGVWRDSNDAEPNLGVGSHIVEYKTVFGWNEPNSQTVQINDGQTTATTGTYIRQLGSLQVAILPQDAIDAGAQWRVVGGIWRDSNDIEPNLAVGTHTVEYRHIANWNEPNSHTVQIDYLQTTAALGTYIPTGSLQVTILPQAAIDAGAQWRVDGGIWRDSNDIEPNLAVGLHTVEFMPIPNWNEPNSQIIQIDHGQTAATSGMYIQSGSLHVTISPQEAIDAGAQWRVVGGPWRDSNYVEPNLPVGSYTVEYKPLFGWNEPNSEIVQIDHGQMTTTGGTYIRLRGSLRIIIMPQAAIDAGAQWRVDGGIWHDSNDIEPNLGVGPHTVEYKPLPNFVGPNSQTVQVEEGQTVTATGTYILTGWLQVKILPQEAIDAGAQWRVDGGIWRDSNDIEPNLAVGLHTVEYKPIPNWNEPNSQTVQINHGQLTTSSGTYVRSGSLRVTIFPQEAVDANAQWRVVGGPWRDSNDTEPNLAIGTYTVEYKPLYGWNEPNSQIIQINHGQMTTTSGTYIRQRGSLRVIIEPNEANDIGAQWRVDGGIWHDSNHVEPNLGVGPHIVEYKHITNWNEPNTQTVQVYYKQMTTVTGTYVKSGLLHVIILPPEVIDANAQWRIDGGIWHDSNHVEPNVPVGLHTVEYMPVYGWTEPNSQTVLINQGQITSTSGTYIRQKGSLQVIIEPNEVRDAGAQWRIDRGPWRDSNDTEPNLGVGYHFLEYKSLANWDKPDNDMVLINHNETTNVLGTYFSAGNLQVTILPQEAIDAGAQWRVDSGYWRDSGYIKTNLSAGSHTIEYKQIPDFNEPNSEMVQIEYNQTTSVTATYRHHMGSLTVFILPPEANDAGGQWRVDGGPWRDSNYTEPNLIIGSHTVEFKHAGNAWYMPSDETVPVFYNQTTVINVVYTLRTPLGIPPVNWVKTFGGSDQDYGLSVQQTSDGGYIIAGHVFLDAYFDYDIYLIKTNPNGDVVWQNTYDGGDWDYGHSVQQTADGGYIVAGFTYSSGAGESDFYLLKVDSSGNTDWDSTFGGAAWDEAYSVQQTSDGGYIVAGFTYSFGAGQSDVYVVKTDSRGRKVDEWTYGGTGDDHAWSIQQTSDGGYIITGHTSSFGAGQRDVYLIKITSTGTLQWQNTYNGSNDDVGYSVQQTADGGYIVVGYTSYSCPSSGGQQYDVHLIKTEPNGTSQWEKDFPGADAYCSGDDIGYSVHQTTDGGYIIVGETTSYGAGATDVYLIRTDPNGDEIWQRVFGGSDHDYCESVGQTADGGFVMAGSTRSFGAGEYDVYFAKVCRDGTSCADFNCDDIVDFADLKEFAANWLQPGFPHGDMYPEFEPVIGDGLVDFLDFSIFAHEWLFETIEP